MLQVFVTDVDAYREILPELGRIWRKRFGARHPAMGSFGVARLFDEAAQVELMGVAELPRERSLPRSICISRSNSKSCTAPFASWHTSISTRSLAAAFLGASTVHW